MGKKTQQQRKKKLKYTGKFNCCTLQVAPEQKARATYEKLIDLCRDNPDVLDPLRYLRQREVVHFQRFGEALRGVQNFTWITWNNIITMIVVVNHKKQKKY